ncbi:MULTISPECIES: DegT/DnrJ/EryC1/StrS family aminotransferase [Olivibacter]|uniref:DegT/DnrJ/EryC1/StrS family aminotransferase n=1 Tax=Olivibacter jilunii TaxID=985016 RepID=A0ABW6B759_9SPHI|nr:DegT/DnrJ/EryC1/StrS family aminotransferase [Olivibacter sp. UJ_SKK_5.1]MDX3912647.1 DegT/DnrJ/EryC1/StrS family aminotransferase [Pseudosphingobacterium sp.]
MSQPIQMVDLKSQYYRIKEEIDQALLQAVEDCAYINGPSVQEFREQLCRFNGVSHTITCANGTDALQIAMMGLGFKQGDEVIVPAFTYIATVEVIALLGLIPRFIDVRPDTFELDYEQLASVVNEKTVGIVPVHLFGQCSNMEALLRIAEQYKLKIIEDTAQAIGAEMIFSDGRRSFAGTLGDVGTTSFFPSKNLGCFGDGGALFTNDALLAEKLDMIANHGQRKKYRHEEIGVNSRLDTIQAAILNVKIQYLPQYTEARQDVAARYDQAFSDLDGLEIPFRAKHSTHVFNQYTCKVKHGMRDQLKQFLSEKGVPSMIYYPVPVHLQEAYVSYGYQAGDFPVAEQLCQEVLSFPIHTEMEEQTQEYIIEQVRNFFNK